MSETAPDSASTPPRFAWHRDDPEARLGLGGGSFTRVRSTVWLVAAGAVTALFFGLLLAMPESRAVAMFTQRGAAQPLIILGASWAVLMLLIKQAKIGRQLAALRMDDLVPPDPDFVLSPGTVDSVLARLRGACADHDADVVESSYTLVRGLIWAIPVLGFIGTVQGLSGALGSFGDVLVETNDFATIKPALRGVTGGLSTAFDTTFVGLVSALGVQLLYTVTRKREEDLLDACTDYCQRHVVGRLRLTPFDAGENT